MSGECNYCGEHCLQCVCRKPPDWTSVRHTYPPVSGKYAVWDCQADVFGESYYDGYEFTPWKPRTEKYGMWGLQTFFRTTHWKPIEEKKMAKKWIQDMHMKKGALHKDLGVKKGVKIPEAKLEKAEHSKNPKTRKRANLAETLKKMHKK